MSEEDLLVFVVWKTADFAAQASLLRAMSKEHEAMRGHAGFVAMTIAPSLDGGHVIVHARWESKHAFDAAVTDNPATSSAREDFARSGQMESVTLCRVGATLSPPSPNSTG